ncbi:hypothetical protein EV144_105453 [Flavobacterium sp. 270]|uniref:tetratricopeptide repeat-containing sensor histidine kinase n=1 Tax=Flavobacterium sp. 270 TaxID=2512114 RepID=UPI001064AB0A|nr:ATP-binding protein [Flavobacterium sp. 270]TDW47426.1 hypothetical protein EV144_105453 [Flavobacterium sp. 270]
MGFIDCYCFIQKKSFVRNYFGLLVLGILFFFASCEKKHQPIVKKTYHTAEVKRLTLIADDQFEKTEYESAIINYIKIVQLADVVKDRADYADALISLGFIYNYQSDYFKSETVITQVLPLLKYMKKPRYAWNTYTILGTNYLRTGDLEKALFFYKKAQNLKNSEFRKLCSINNIGLIYLKKKKYNKALQLFLQVANDKYYADTKIPGDKVDLAITLNNVGLCYNYLKNQKALYYYQKALTVSLKVKNRECLAKSYEGLSYYYSERNIKLSKHYALLCYKNACEINFPTLKINALYALIHSSKGEDLKKYSELSVNLSDSISKVRKTAKTQFSHIKYDFKIDKQQNHELKSQKLQSEILLERQKNRNLISYIIIASVLLVITFLTLYMSRLNKKEKRETIYQSEIRISNKLQRELSNVVYNIISYCQNTNLEVKERKEDLLLKLDNIYQQTRNISRDNSFIITDENYIFELEEMIAQFKTPKKNIFTYGLETISWNKIDKNKKIIVYRVIQELFSNIRKDSEATLASITFKVSNKEFVITYIDNGNRIEDKNIVFRNGLQNMENRVNTIKGKIEIKSNKNESFKVFIKFPI